MKPFTSFFHVTAATVLVMACSVDATEPKSGYYKGTITVKHELSKLESPTGRHPIVKSSSTARAILDDASNYFVILAPAAAGEAYPNQAKQSIFNLDTQTYLVQESNGTQHPIPVANLILTANSVSFDAIFTPSIASAYQWDVTVSVRLARER